MNLARTAILTISALAALHSTSGAESIVNGVRVDGPAPAPVPDAVTPQRPALAVLVDFDGAAAPCAFYLTVALRNEYAGVGVTFSGPGATGGGAILDQCGNFGVVGYSPPNFVAFNTDPAAQMQDGGFPVGPERMDFSQDVGSVQVSVGGPTGGIAILTAYSAASLQLASASVLVANAMQTLTVNAAGIRFAVLEVQGDAHSAWVFDDLSFDTMPTPVTGSTWGRVKMAYR